MVYNSRTCGCTVQQYSPIIFNSVAYQGSANTVYEAKNTILDKSRNGTLGTTATGNPIFKSEYERMQFLLGAQARAPCNAGSAGKSFAPGTN